MQKLLSAVGTSALVLSLLVGCGDDPPADTYVGSSVTPDGGAPVTNVSPPVMQPTVNPASNDAGQKPAVTPSMPIVTTPADAGAPVVVDAGLTSSDAGPVTTGDAGPSSGGPTTPIMRGDDPTSASASAKGPFKVMTYTSGFPVMLYGGGTIHYPTDAQPPFGAVAVCPGFTAAQSSIQSWGPFLASHGIVTLTMDTLTPLDVVDQRVDELMDALASIKSENGRMASPLFNKIDTNRLGVMGWSMGGGGTWLAAAMHPELKSAVSFAGHILTALNQDVSKTMVPSLLLAGSADTAILGGGMSQPVYDMIPMSTPKMVWEVQGAGHDVANSPSNTGGAIGRYGLSWQKVYLEGDMRYKKFLLEKAPNASYFKTNLQ